MSIDPSQAVNALSRAWTGRLAGYRQHLNDEHREALVVEAARYAGIRLENDLSRSPYWNDRPLLRRAAVLLYLVDRGVIDRVISPGSGSGSSRVRYEPRPDAEMKILELTTLAPYIGPTLDLISALRRDLLRRQPRPPARAD
jgi:hypothetical protein